MNKISGDKEVWTFVEQKKGEIHPVSYELIGKAKEISNDLNASLCSVLLTPDESGGKKLTRRGVDKVILVESDIFSSPNEIVYKKNLVSLLRKNKPEVFLIGATKFGRSLAPRIAASLKTGLTADCTDLKVDEEKNLVQIRPAFTGNVLAHIVTDTKPVMSTVRYGEFEMADKNSENSGKIIKKDPITNIDSKIEVVKESEKEEVNIEEENIIVAGGRGLREPSDFCLLEELADLLNGEVGSSRPLVDEGWIDRCHQVGYSGKRVKPSLYFACGISGAPQHLAGMKESKTIIAINSDPSAPIFDIADYGIVGDLYEVVPLLLKEIKEVKNER